MLSHRNYLNQVALIESECEPRKKVINIPATVFNRSPIRDRQNKSNLANMNGNPTRSGCKPSPSPLRGRKCDTSVSMRSPNNHKQSQTDCTNHPNKTAKYIVQSDEETLFYCQKCAILLASQGFKVSKLTDNQIYDSCRQEEVEQFLYQLQGLMNKLLKKQNLVDNILKEGTSQHQNQIEKIQSYYSQFYEIIDQHKRTVLQEMKLEFDTSFHNISQISCNLNEAVQQSNSMKQDIHASINSIILEANQTEYRPVIDLYKQKVRKYMTVLNRSVPEQQIRVRKVCFKDGQELCRIIAQGISVEWEDQKNANESNLQYSIPQDRQINPVETIQNQQRFAKSSMRDIGNLFCSFDQ